MGKLDIITIDGPVSSGKSSVGLAFAQKIGYEFVDSGAIYRAGALLMLQDKISLEDTSKIIEIFQNLKMKFETRDGHQHVFVNGKEVTDILHNPDVTVVVPIVAQIPEVREYVKAIQKQIASSQNTVMTGRDTGTEIFPDAPLKFYITASAEARAKRRFTQLKDKRPGVTFETILEEISDRDLKDTTRALSPLKIPEGAVVVDTSNLSIEESVKELLKAYAKIAG